MHDKKKIVFEYELGDVQKDTDSTSYLSPPPENLLKNLKDLAYKSFLRPKLERSCSMWDPYTVANIKKLEGVQRLSARFVCSKYSHHVRYIQAERLVIFLEETSRKRLTLFHRVVNETVNVDAIAHIHE